MRIEVVLAWPDHYSAVQLDLPDGATVADAVVLSSLALEQAPAAHAVHGVIARPEQVLREGDRSNCSGRCCWIQSRRGVAGPD